MVYVYRWSSGVIMYTLLAGSPPFWHRKQMLMLRMILAGNYAFSSPEWEDRSDTVKDLVGFVSQVYTLNELRKIKESDHLRNLVVKFEVALRFYSLNSSCGPLRSRGCWWWIRSSVSQPRMLSTTRSSHSMWCMKCDSSAHTDASRWDNRDFKKKTLMFYMPPFS